MPPGSDEVSKLGDCVIVTSRLLRAMLSVLALGSMKPRFDDAMGLVKRAKDSKAHDETQMGNG